MYLQENIFHVIKSHKHWNDKTENSQKVKDHQVGLDNKICTLVRTISSQYVTSKDRCIHLKKQLSIKP